MTLTIALDGPAGAGKSTVAKGVAARLGLLYLDTGALYRAIAVGVSRAGIDPTNAAAVAALLPHLAVTVTHEQGAQVTRLNGQPLDGALRTPDISQLASALSAQAAVRAALLDLQRGIAASLPCVLDGRDIGTAVLPDCPHKFFITADVRERARRRQLEDAAHGLRRPLDEVEAEIAARDLRDSTRDIAPLRRAEDAIEIDTTRLTIQQAIDTVVAAVTGKEPSA